MSKLRRIPRERRVALTAVLAVIAVTLAMVTVTGARAEAAEPTDFEPNYDMGLESVRNSGDDSWGPLVWAGTPPEGNSTGNAANDVGWGWCIDYTQADPMHKGGSYKKSTAGALSFDDPKYQDAVIGLALKLRDAQENGQKQLAKKYIVYLSAIISDPSGREAAINFINGNLGYGDANNVSRFQGFEGSPQEFTELTGLRIVKTTAQNLDDQFDVDPSVKIDKQPADAFLTIVGPNGIYKHTSGGGQRVLPPDQPGLPDDDGGEDRNPEISTQAEFAGDADQVVAGAKVTDTVEYKDLVPGKKYTLNAELVNKADKSVVGKGEKTFTPQESAGKVDVEITVDSDVTEPVEAAVAFEELTSTEVDAKGEETPDAEKPNKVAEHKDIDDADQTVTSKKDEKPEKSDRNPEISTQAEFAGDADQVVAGAKVTDTVEYKDLVPGKKYTLNAELVNKADKSVVGKGEKTFTPQESAGKVDVEITVDSDVTEPVEAAVAFEELTSTEVDAKGEETPDAEKPNKVAEHKDIDDADQTVTSKKDEKPEKDNKPSETSTPMTSTSSSKPSTSESKSSEPKKETTSESKPSEPSETKTSSSKTSANAKPSTSTSSEKSKEPRPTEVQGQEPGDSPEPKITTDADFAEGSHVVVAGAKIVDEVSYEGLVPGKEYTLKAELISKKDEKTVLGTGEKTFTPEKSAGKVDVEITVHDDVTEPVEAAVAFEELTSVEVDAKGEETPDAEKPNKVAEHKDIDDADQTVTSKKDEKPEKSDRNPEISTQAEFAGDADQVVAGAKVTDTVEYKDLVPGKKYTLNAELVNKADKSVVGKGEKTFTPQESAGKVDVEITVDSDVTEPVEAAVAFEELTSTEVDAKGEETPDAEKPNKVAEHKDIDDADQTVTSKKDEKPEKDNKPSETSTPMTSTSSSKPSTSESKSSEPKKETTSESKPSEPSETKTSSSKTSANAKPSTSTSSEKSKEPRPTEVQGQEPGDSPEPKITTDADFAEGSHVVVAGAKIVDEVSYEGLVPGKEYTLKAELISKKDEKTVLGTGEKTFTPEKSAGKVDVEITVHDDVTEPVEAAVAFEELTSVEVDAKGEETPDVTPEKPNHIAEHKDINDDDQTVTSKKDEKPESKPKEKAESQSERPSVKVKEQDAPAQADKGTGKVEQHVDITNHVPGKTGKPLPSDAKRTEIKSVPSGATELEPGMQTYIK